ncbi:phage tail-collar fiber domain-containing protein [Providencia manganoxydans]|uniref:phage tail-collar fiber domain-containing protein n=1 Tax=Providencia manganoxydans TaxID=2923283 RepID=UPI0034E487F7
MTPFYTTLTNYGKTALAEALAAQKPLEIPHMAVGDGGGEYYEPTENQTNLRNERWRGELNDLRTDDEQQGQVIAEAIIPMGIDGDWTVREIGLFDKSGGLIAVGKYPEVYIPPAYSGAKTQVYINIIIKIDNVAAIQLIVDHGQVLASKLFVMNKGYGTVGSFESGLFEIKALTNPYQLVLFEKENALYRWNGVFPKPVPAGSTPSQEGGIGSTAWVPLYDGSHSKLLVFKNVTSMINGVNTEGIDTPLSIGRKCITGETCWTITDNKEGIALSNGLFAMPTSNICLNDFGFTKDIDCSKDIERICKMASEFHITRVFSTDNATYLHEDTIDLTGVSGVTLDYGKAIVIDNVQGISTVLSHRAKPTYIIYNSAGTTVERISHFTAPTRTASGGADPIFWIGGQQLGAKVTNSPSVRDVVLENTKAGCMPVAVVGNTRNWKVERIDVYGDSTWGIDVEWGWQGTEFNKTAGVPENPDTNQTMDNGQLPYNGKVINFNGYDLQNCKGFLRTAGCYNVKFENCEGYNVHNFIYVYGGDRNPSRFTQNDRFKGCKLKINRQTFLKPTYGITIIFPNLDGTTKDPLPDWTNYDHTVVFDDCEIQGNYINDEIQSCAVRFYACTGAVVFNRCTFSNSYYGVRAERATSNGTYISSNALRFNNCIFKKNYQDVKLDAINGVIFNQSKFKSMLGKDNPSVSIGGGYQSDLNKFIDCTWSGQNNRDDGVQEFIHIGNGAGNALIRCDFRMHKTTYKAIKYVGAGVLSGYDNTSNGQLVDTAYETNKIHGQKSTLVKGTNGLNGDVIDFNKGEIFLATSAFSIAQCINGAAGDRLIIRGVLGGTACSILHNKAPSGGGRFLNKGNTNYNESSEFWTHEYIHANGDWYEI